LAYQYFCNNTLWLLARYQHFAPASQWLPRCIVRHQVVQAGRKTTHRKPGLLARALLVHGAP
jgi:hypothetical protein